MAKKKKQESKGAPKWMTTFSDMTTLLLTFFVLLLSMANFDKRKVQEFLGVITGGTGIFDKTSFSQLADINTITRKSIKESVQTTKEKTEKNIKEIIKSQNLEKLVSVIKTDKGVSVRIMDSAFFRTGSADLEPMAYQLLNKIITVVEETPYNINIEGHTDDTPIGNQAFSNWELSNARALSVLKHMLNQGFNPVRLSASGFGEYHPLLPNITEENRAKNRRVEINIVTPEFAESGKNLFQDEP